VEGVLSLVLGCNKLECRQWLASSVEEGQEWDSRQEAGTLSLEVPMSRRAQETWSVQTKLDAMERFTNPRVVKSRVRSGHGLKKSWDFNGQTTGTEPRGGKPQEGFVSGRWTCAKMEKSVTMMEKLVVSG